MKISHWVKKYAEMIEIIEWSDKDFKAAVNKNSSTRKNILEANENRKFQQRSNIYVIRVLEVEEKYGMTEKVFEEIMMKVS